MSCLTSICKMSVKMKYLDLYSSCKAVKFVPIKRTIKYLFYKYLELMKSFNN